MTMSGGSGSRSAKRTLLSLRTAWCAALLSGWLACQGCGGPAGPPTFKVQGKVTLDGAPLATGDLIFYDADNKVGPDRAVIVDGAYNLRAKAGPRRVEISSTREIGKVAVPGKADAQIPDMQQQIAPEFNKNSTLKVEIKPQNSGNEFNFDVKSDPKAAKSSAGK